MRSISIIILSIAFLGLLSAQVLAFPLLDFQGQVFVDSDGSAQPLNTTKVTSWIDEDGLPGSISDPSDPIVGQSVYGISSSFQYDFAHDFLTVDSNALGSFYIGDANGVDPYLTATASNFTVTKLDPYKYTVSALLSNQQYFHTDTSTFMAQYKANSPLTGIQGSLMTWDVVFGIPTNSNIDYDYFINVSGKVNTVPEPGTLILLGSGLLGLVGLGYRRKKGKV